jgi:hypothetical protein
LNATDESYSASIGNNGAYLREEQRSYSSSAWFWVPAPGQSYLGVAEPIEWTVTSEPAE